MSFKRSQGQFQAEEVEVLVTDAGPDVLCEHLESPEQPQSQQHNPPGQKATTGLQNCMVVQRCSAVRFHERILT